MDNNRGKTLNIFIILIVVTLASATSIGFFLYNKEANLRNKAEVALKEIQTAEMKLQADLKEARRGLALAQDKNKEADDHINNLMDEIELNEGLRKELKNENSTLKQAAESAKKEKEKIKAEFDDAQKKYDQVVELLKIEQDKANILQNTIKDLEKAKEQAEQRLETMKTDAATGTILPEKVPGDPKVQLDKIVVNPNDGTRGKVLSVDKQAEFLVCNLGSKKGVKAGDVISVYRSDEYLGDVKVTRVQEELCAADLIPPFSSRKVRKNDTVVFRP